MNPIAIPASWRVAHLAAVAAIVAGSLAIAGGASAAPTDPVPVAGDWPQFHLGADKTGWNGTEQTLSSSNVAALGQRWHVAGADAGSPILVGERVFATFGDQLVAVSREDGMQLWRQALPGWVTIPPSAIAAGGELVVVAAGGEVSAYRQSDGTRTWSAPIGGSSRGPTIAGERVYVGSSDENVHAFDLASGQPLWTAPTNGDVQSLIAVADGRVFAASMDGTLSAFDASTGAVDWSAPVGEVFGGGAAVAHGNVYIAGDVPSRRKRRHPVRVPRDERAPEVDRTARR